MSEERTTDTYERLGQKLEQLATTLPPDEASALVLILEHAKEHTTASTGYEFEDVEPETAGFMIGLINSPGVAGSPRDFTGGMLGGNVGQFGRVSGAYMPASFQGGGAQMF